MWNWLKSVLEYETHHGLDDYEPDVLAEQLDRHQWFLKEVEYKQDRVKSKGLTRTDVLVPKEDYCQFMEDLPGEREGILAATKRMRDPEKIVEYFDLADVAVTFQKRLEKKGKKLGLCP